MSVVTERILDNISGLYIFNKKESERNGIFPGERLILTYETGQTTLSNAIIEAMVKRYLL